MIISRFEQGSQEWLDERIGKLTGTRIKKILTPAKLGLAKGFEVVALEMIDENVTGISNETTFKSDAMIRGSELEPIAREEYTKATGIKIKEVGLCIKESNILHALSPDGLTEDETGAIEIKCCGGAKHLAYICDDFEDSIYSDYKLQCINYFIVNPKLQWLDTVAYRPEFYPCPLHIVRIKREDIIEDIIKVDNAIKLFFEKYHELYNELTF